MDFKALAKVRQLEIQKVQSSFSWYATKPNEPQAIFVSAAASQEKDKG